MFGAIVGDIAGSTYEVSNLKDENCEIFRAGSRFTDDTVLTLATAACALAGGSYQDYYRRFGRRYPEAGYGGSFMAWLYSTQPAPYGSWGNGAAMRVSPLGWSAGTLEQALQEARSSAAVTHDHPEGVKGAQAVATAVFLARTGHDKKALRTFICSRFGYNLERRLADIRPGYRFDVSCQGSVPEAIIAFLESTDFEDALRKAISLGGDSDTIACISGAIAHAFYGEIPSWMVDYCDRALDAEQRKVIESFWQHYPRS